MKKRIIATLLVGACAATTVIGFSACGSSVSLPKGDSVSNEDAWVSAFEKLLDDEKLINYTVGYSETTEQTLKGKYSTYELYNDKTETTDIANYTTKSSKNRTVLYDVKNNKAYSESSSSSSQKGTVDDETANASSKENNKQYYELYTNKDNLKTYWRARYSKGEDSNSLYGKESSESYWRASTTTNFMESSLYYAVSGTYYDSSNKEEAKRYTLDELYDKFSYSNGVYTATLYTSVDIYRSASELLETTVSVSISDGCVVGVSEKINAKNTISQSINKDKLVYVGYDLEYTYKYEVVYALTNIGNTDTSKKVNKDITNAIAKAKKDYEKD